MSKRSIRRSALALAILASAVSPSFGENRYSSPSRWNNFRPILDEAMAEEDASESDSLLSGSDSLLAGPEIDRPTRSFSDVQDLPAPAPAAPKREPYSGPSGYDLDQGSGQSIGSSPAASGPSIQYGTQSSSAPTPGYGSSVVAPTSGAHTPASPVYNAPVATSHTSMHGQPMVAPSVSGGHAYGTPVYSSPAPTGAGCGGNCGPVGVNAYQSAMSGPWEAGSSGCYSGGCGADVRPELYPWFAGANLLFFDLEEGKGRLVENGLGLRTTAVSPDASLGFDATFGRYFGCGKYGFGVTYFNWNPSSEQFLATGAAGTIRAAMPHYRDISAPVDGVNVDTIYNAIDGTDGAGGANANYAGATNVRLTRNLRFQGIEANLFSFGLMGAQRASYAGCGTHYHGAPGALGLTSATHGLLRGYGGAAGPLVRSCSGRVRVMTSHGFRWFQVQDDLEFAYNVDGTAGYQGGDIYDSVQTENNLFGYQFGGRLTYCLGGRLDLNIGGKFGIYGNRAELRHRVGNDNGDAYLTGATGDVINVYAEDTSLATLGELDLGLGYRITNAWTIRGGYRLIGVSGVAVAVDSIPNNYASVADLYHLDANDSYILHGGYVGAEFNW
ncbi:MAG: BBP7 family outer membrane beta-barrel protein [Planctomycetota bacterium]